MASTKQAIVNRANQRHVAFIGGHPMAGREIAVAACLGRPWSLCPGALARPTDFDRVEQLVAACGAEVHLAAREHDPAVAGISHLPLALAAAWTFVGDADDWPIARAWRRAAGRARPDGCRAGRHERPRCRIRARHDPLGGSLADLEETPDGPRGDRRPDGAAPGGGRGQRPGRLNERVLVVPRTAGYSWARLAGRARGLAGVLQMIARGGPVRAAGEVEHLRRKQVIPHLVVCRAGS